MEFPGSIVLRNCTYNFQLDTAEEASGFRGPRGPHEYVRSQWFWTYSVISSQLPILSTNIYLNVKVYLHSWLLMHAIKLVPHSGGGDNLKVIISSQWKLSSDYLWVPWQFLGWKLDLNRHREWGWVFGEIWGAFGHDASVSKSNRMLTSFAFHL